MINQKYGKLNKNVALYVLNSVLLIKEKNEDTYDIGKEINKGQEDNETF